MAPVNQLIMQHLLLSLSILAQACNVQPPITDFPYQMESPAQTFEMPNQLKEISGLTLGFNDNTLFAIEDENGLLFLLDKRSGAVLQEVPFWKDGDYESVEMVGEDVFVGKSNGNLYQIQHPGTEAQTVIKHESPLDKSCNVEGLALERDKNRLLLSCKGDAFYEHARAVFSFNLQTMTFDSLPAYIISWDSILTFIQNNPELDRWDKLMEIFNPEEPELAFSPSALAIHPITGDLYLLSSVGKLLLVLDQETGSILYVQKLKKSVHPQPEGICFDPDGTMYISNEGKDGNGLIHRFAYSPK